MGPLPHVLGVAPARTKVGTRSYEGAVFFSSSPLQLPPLPVEAAGAAGVLTTPMASADHRLAALVAAFAFAQVRSATLAVVRPGRAALSALLPQQQLFLLPSLPPPSFSPQAWSASCFATESASMVS